MRDQLKHLKEKAFTGSELVQDTARVCATNMLFAADLDAEVDAQA